MIELAKPALDIGLYTNRRDESLAFWGSEVGLTYSQLLPVGAGVQQHRHLIGESVLKVNHSREPLAEAVGGGIRAITIATPGLSDSQRLEDPDGNVVVLAPPRSGVAQLRVHLTVSDLSRHREFYGQTLGLEDLGADVFRCEVSQIELIEGSAHKDPEQRAPGYRYLTVQVFDVKQTHHDILAAGGREGMAPVKLGDVAHISFVRDPDGNWIEISQRKSLVGSPD